MNGNAMKLKPCLLAAVVLALLWELAARGWQDPLLPPLWTVLSVFCHDLPGALGQHALASLQRVLGGMLLAAAGAIPGGLLLGQHPRLNRVLAPAVYLLYPVPKVVLVPVLLLLFGVGDFPKVLVIALILFFQMLVLVRDSAAAVRPELLLSVRSMGAGAWDLLRFVYLPASLPAVFSAVRQSVGTAIAVLYVAELVACDRGLGYYIFLTGSTLFDYPAMYAGILAMSLMGLGLFCCVDLADRRWCAWAGAGRS